MDELDLEKVRRTGTFTGVPSWAEGVKAGGSEGLGLGLSIFNMIDAERMALTAGLTAIDKDERLTRKGKQEAKAALGERHARKAAEIRQHIGQLKRGRDRKAEQAAVRDPFDDNAVALAVWTSMVANLLPADALKTKMAYEAAVEAGDLRTAVAIEAMPALHPGRPDDATMAELRAARIRADDPAAARAIGDQDRAIADLEALAGELAGEVRQLTGADATALRVNGKLVDGAGRELDPDTYEPIEEAAPPA